MTVKGDIMEEKNENKAVTLKEAANIKYLSPDDAVFEKNGDFIKAKIKFDCEEKEYPRVWLHRSFPFNMPENYISVQDSESEEIGMIRSLSDFDEETRKVLSDELSRKYYTPHLIKILSLKETRGYSYWRVLSDAGEISFTLQDTQKSITKFGEDRAFITDICGSRYEIPSLEAFDKKSLKKIEIYL